LSARSQKKFKLELNKKFIFLLRQTNPITNVSNIQITFVALATGTIGKPDYQGPSGVKCSFGAFGTSMGMFIN